MHNQIIYLYLYLSVCVRVITPRTKVPNPTLNLQAAGPMSCSCQGQSESWQIYPETWVVPSLEVTGLGAATGRYGLDHCRTIIDFDLETVDGQFFWGTPTKLMILKV